MRLATIDIGTNSVHMIVVQVRPDLSFEVIDREKEMVRLGAGGLDGRKLTPDAMHAALQVLSKFRRLAESHRVDQVIAVATSATREAENGGEFLQAVTQQTGIRPRVISGTEEARLIHLAAVYGVSVPGDVAVVIDIGGGSVEVTRGTGSAIELGRSFFPDESELSRLFHEAQHAMLVLARRAGADPEFSFEAGSSRRMLTVKVQNRGLLPLRNLRKRSFCFSVAESSTKR